MSDTVLEHPLVRDYLRRLDAACASLPPKQGRELREQIAAHLDEALPPGASDEQVLDELGRLGSPRSLAADIAGPERGTVTRRLRNRLGHVRWWTWVSIGSAVALFGSAVTYALLALHAAPLSEGSVSGWYYPQDQKVSVETQAGDSTQFTVPERFGQEQGLIITVNNDSDWTQTILSVGPHFQPWSFVPLQAAVGSGKWADVGSAAGPISWSSPGSVPPHSSRMLRVLWHTDYCMPPGGGGAIQEIVLTVRVGIFTRTEVVPLDFAWGVAGVKRTQCH